MSLVYTISDPHFGHENMAIRRGFKNAEEQDNLIIENWNKTVNKKDVVLLLGDITMETPKFYHYLNKLNGLKSTVQLLQIEKKKLEATGKYRLGKIEVRTKEGFKHKLIL